MLFLLQFQTLFLVRILKTKCPERDGGMSNIPEIKRNFSWPWHLALISSIHWITFLLEAQNIFTSFTLIIYILIIYIDINNSPEEFLTSAANCLINPEMHVKRQATVSLQRYWDVKLSGWRHTSSSIQYGATLLPPQSVPHYSYKFVSMTEGQTDLLPLHLKWGWE